VITGLILAATYAVIAAGRAPFLKLDRTGAAILGALLMVLTGAIGLDEAAKDNILQLIAPQLPPEARLSAKEQLPAALNAIWGMTVLPNGYLAVKRITGLESVEVDLFDKEGRLLYTILPSPEIPDLRGAVIFRNTIGVIFEGEEGNLYVEYRVKNLKEIWD